VNTHNNHEPDHLRARRDAETLTKVIRSAVTSWLDDQTPQWVHLALVLEEVDLFAIAGQLRRTTLIGLDRGPTGYIILVLDIVTHTLDEHPDYHRLATGSRPLLVSDGTYAWCVWERDVDEDAQAVLPAPVLGAVA
jgi:hypothetical protein